MTVAVRIASDADLAPALAVWKSANAARGMPASPQRTARVQENLADPDAVVLVAIQDRAVIGMLVAEAGRSDGNGAVIPDLGHISMVFIRPDCQGRGVGGDLLNQLIPIALDRGWRRLSLWTRRSNSTARRLYDKHGFSITTDSKHLAGGDPIDRWQRDVQAGSGGPDRPGDKGC